MAVLSIYLPPSIDASSLGNAFETLNGAVDKIRTKFPDAIIFVGGDFNRKNMSPFTSVFPDLKPINAGATRNGAELDQVYTNMHDK